jgi:small-conductance mechanosensitive channel
MKTTAIIVGSILFLPAVSFTQSPQDAESGTNVSQILVAPVKVDGEIIFYVRGTSSFSAEQRADAICDRIISASRDQSVPIDSVRIIPRAELMRIFAGKHFIINLYEADATKEGIHLSVLAEMVQQKIRSAIEIYRHDRSRPVMIKNSLYAIGALILLLVSLFILLLLLRWLHRLIENRIRSRFESMENKSYHLIQSGQLWKGFHLLFRILRIAIIVLLIAIFLQYILGLFPWTNQVAVYTLNLFLEPIVTLGKGCLQFIPNLAFLIVIYLVARYLLKLIKMLFRGIQAGEISINSFRHEWAMPTYKILRLLVIVFAVIIAYPYIPGSDSNAFKGVSVFLGILLSLGSSSFIGNLIAGYSMTYRGAFKIGDRIMVEGQVGFVEEQKLLVTRLRSIKNEEIVIPNSVLLNSNIVNYSTKAKESGVILHTTVGIGYETSWRQVEAMLKLAATRTEGLLKEPPPFVMQHSLGDFAVSYELNVYCDDVTRMNYFYTRLHQNILDVFNENHVQIMTPAYEGDPETPKVVPSDQWNIPLARET